MAGAGQYFWVGIGQMCCFVSLNIIAFKFIKTKSKLASRLLFAIGLYLLVYKICEYTSYQIKGMHKQVPIEISAVSYFLLGFSIVLRNKRLQVFAAFCGMFSGLFYNINFIILPEMFILSRSSWFLLVMATINHSLLYFGSIMVLKTVQFDKTDVMYVGLGTLLINLYSLGVQFLIKIDGKPIIMQVIDGTIIDKLSVALRSLSFFYPIYYFIIFSILIFMFASFFKINELIFKRQKSSELNCILDNQNESVDKS
ncbi:MAG: hypothetical protein RR357_02730 [Clostridia bacterium]